MSLMTIADGGGEAVVQYLFDNRALAPLTSIKLKLHGETKTFAVADMHPFK